MVKFRLFLWGCLLSCNFLILAQPGVFPPAGLRPNISNFQNQFGAGVTNQFGAGVTDQFGAGVTNRFGAGVTNRFGAGVTNRFFVPSPQNEFQRFVETSTGQKLPIFGHDLFNRDTASLLPGANLPVTADYEVGPGDELIVRAWGALDMNLQLTVDRNGAINIPRVGVLQVAGLKANQVEGFVKTQVGRLFQNFEMNVAFGRLRSIKVLVVGSARRPGNYSVSALSTALSVLFQAGGPSHVGSMRRIEVIRGNQVSTELDLYDLLLKGDKTKDIRLIHGDIVRVLPMGPVVAISGSVQIPAIYELKGAETFKSVIDKAGGLTAIADKGIATIERITDQSKRVIQTVELLDSGLNTPLQKGDVISIEPISPQFDQVVSLRGHVDLPRRYKWSQGMRIKDLIPSNKYLIPREYWSRINQLTETEEMGGIETTDPTRLVRGLLNQVNWQYATITRLDPKDLSNKIVTFNLGAALRDNAPEENHLLHPGDVVTIYSRKDIGVPKSMKDSLVTLKGEVVNPGVYRIEPGESLADLIERVGGFTKDAYVYASVFTRQSVRIEQQARLDQSIARIEKELAQASAEMQARTLAAESKDSLEAMTAARVKSLQTMRSTLATGRITLGLDREISNPKQLPNLELQDGDTFVVPAKMNEIHIMGEVYNQQASIWRSGNTVLDSLAVSGGPTRFADIKQLFIIRADGTVESRAQVGKKFARMQLYPGDTLVVPEDMDFYNWKFELKEWVKIFSDFALGVAAIRVISN